MEPFEVKLEKRMRELRIRGIDAAALANRISWVQGEYRRRNEACAINRVLLACGDETDFIGAFLALANQPVQLFLGNPKWGADERKMAFAVARPDWILADGGYPDEPANDGQPSNSDTSKLPEILIPTGGTSGGVRFARHNWSTLSSAVEGFRRHFGVEQIDCWCVLPLFHVSGLMQLVRSLLSGGRLTVGAAARLDPVPGEPGRGFLSVVPTQLQRMLESDGYDVWLRGFDAVFVGGAAAWPSLLAEGRRRKLPLATTFGMTETAAQVATLLPSEFLTGRDGQGRSMVHAELTVVDGSTGKRTACGEAGRLMIRGGSLFTGYVPGGERSEDGFLTEDIARIDSDGFLHVIGRASFVINTGGEKVFPEEVEGCLLASGQVREAVVVGISDSDWGQMVCAAVVPSAEDFDTNRLATWARERLAPFKVPKRWVRTDKIRRSDQGKINRAAIAEWVAAELAKP